MHVSMRIGRSLLSSSCRQRPVTGSVSARRPCLATRSHCSSRGAEAPAGGFPQPQEVPSAHARQPLPATQPIIRAIDLPAVVYQQTGSATEAAMLLLPG